MNIGHLNYLQERWFYNRHLKPDSLVSNLPITSIEPYPEVFQYRSKQLTGRKQEDHVRKLERAVRSTASHLDPITVYWIDGQYYLIDGHHRYEAYQRCASQKPELMSCIPVTEFVGTFQEAYKYALAANVNDKLPMHPDEKLNAAWEALKLDKEYYRFDADICRHTGVSRGTLTNYRSLRAELESQGFRPNNLTRQEAFRHGKSSVLYAEAEVEVAAGKMATALRKVIGTNARTNPKVLARALNILAGESYTEELCMELIELAGGYKALREAVEEQDDTPF